MIRNHIKANMQDRREKITQAITTGLTEGAVAGFKKGAREGAQQGASEGFKKGASEGFRDGASDGFKQGAREGFQENGVKGAIKGGAQGALKGGTRSALQTGTQEAIKGGVHGAIKGGTQEAIKGGVHGAINSGVKSIIDKTPPAPQSQNYNNNLSLFSEPKHVESSSKLINKVSAGCIKGATEGAKEGYINGFKTGFKENGIEGAREKGRQSAILGGIHGGINGGVDALNDDNSKNVAEKSNEIERYNDTSITHSTAISQGPNLDDLKKASDKFTYLNQTHGKQIGWYLGTILVHSRDWSRVNEYINILTGLHSNIEHRSQFIHHDNFVNYISLANMDPSVIFNLMNNFIIPAHLIKKSALKKGLKEKIMTHIEDRFNDVEQLQIWKKCIDQNGSLGEFFNTKKHSWTSKTTSIREIEQKIERFKKNELCAGLMSPLQTVSSAPVPAEISAPSAVQVVYPAVSYPEVVSGHVDRNQLFQPQQSPVTPDVVVNKSTALPPLYVFATGAVVLVVLLSYLAQQSEDNEINQRPGF